MKELEFTVGDFEYLCQCPKNNPTKRCYDWCLSVDMHDYVNHVLADKLAKADVIFGTSRVVLGETFIEWAVGVPPQGPNPNNYPAPTHTARLVCVEEIKN